MKKQKGGDLVGQHGTISRSIFKRIYHKDKENSMVEKTYAHRHIVDKLGVKQGDAVIFALEAKEVDVALRQQILQRAGRPAVEHRFRKAPVFRDRSC